MSKYKKIRELLSFYIITAYQDMENKDLFEEEGDSNKEDDDDLVMLGLTSLLRIKYLEQRSYHVAKSKDWYNYILPKYEDCRFKKIIRMNSINFQKLVSLLITHPIFQNNRNHLQASVELQLAIFLRRIGSKEDIFGLCSRFGITKETIYLYCKRQPETYWNRKKKYSIQLQGIVDYRGMFIDYEIGWPGLIHDTKVYKNSYFYRNVSKIIKEEEYLLGNSAYPIFIFLIKPFVNSQNPSQIQFNVIHSLHRVVAENAFGRLKNRFITLKELNIRDTAWVGFRSMEKPSFVRPFGWASVFRRTGKFQRFDRVEWASDLREKKNQDSSQVSRVSSEERKKPKIRKFGWIAKEQSKIRIYEYMNHIIVELY
ncbi:putative nuclease HARBI1 [Rhizophagus irregularis DAOM 181602=DAOM 197198]|nr:putative nuclease HARBI1 [Rhizophagus irregularis DAOM 181602=DAOM 197198]